MQALTSWAVQFGLTNAYRAAVLADGPVGYWRLDETEGYAQAVLSDAPLGYWRMDAASGTTETDRSTGGNNGTYHGSFALNQSGVLSDGDAAVTFSNGNGYLDLGSVGALRPTAAFTIEAWINLNASVFPDGTTNWIIYDWQVFNASGTVFRVDGGTGKLQAITNQAGANTSAFNNTALVTNAWYHTVFTFDGTTGRFYLNGAADGSAAFTAPVAAANNVFISRTVQGMVGSMDEVALYSYALSLQDVQNHYALRTSTIATVAAKTVADTSGSGWTATVNRGVTLAQSGALSDGNTAALFDGATGSFIETSAVFNYAFGTGPLTVEYWFKTTSALAQIGVVDDKNAGSTDAGFNSAFFAGAPFFRVANGVTQAGLQSVNTFNDGAWHHFVGVFRRGTPDTLSIYIDGVLDTGPTSVGASGWNITQAAHKLRLGAYSTGGSPNFFLGTLDEVAIYPTALSAARILTHYQLRTGWQDVTTDVQIGVTPLMFNYGIQAAGPTDRVAGTGQCSFALNNDTTNSGGLQGYYSPLHANCRSGFGWGIPVRIAFTFGGVTYYKWRGKISRISPLPGKKRERITLVQCVDWMEEAARFEVKDVSMQIGKRSDQVFSAVLATMPMQPAATSIGTGQDIYAVALDDLGASNPSAATTFQKLAQSEFGFVYVKGDTTQGGTLVFEPRNMRSALTNVFSLNDNMTAMAVPTDLSMLFNRVDTIVHPRKIDAAPTTVLWASTTSTPVEIAPGTTVTVWADFHDPSQPVAQIGATGVITPLVAGIDYVMSDSSGIDMTSSCSIVTTVFATAAKFTITNSSVNATGRLTTLQIRGQGIYNYTPITSRSEDTISQAALGLSAIEIDMPYQDNPNNGQAAADLVKHLYNSSLAWCQSLAFFASTSSSLLTAALAREIGDRIGVTETVTGLSTSGSKGHFIQSIAFAVESSAIGPLITCNWTFVPADTGSYWVLDSLTASQLDNTTILGYF